MTDLTSGRDASVALPEWRLPALSATSLISGVTTCLSVLTFFTVLTAVLLWPCLAHYRSALIGPPEDNMQDFWNTWYAAVAHTPGHFFSTNLLRFPEGTPLIYHSFAYPQVFAVVALSRVFGTDLGTLIALQNLTLLASFPLAALGAFYLVRHLVGSTVGGVFGGFVFAFNPSHVAHVLHHAHVSSIEFLPFFALCYLLALDRRSYAWLAGAVIFTALSALSCWYYLFYCAYFMGFQMLYERVRDGAWPRGWRLASPALCLLVAGAILSPIILPMMMMTRPSVYDMGANIYVADLSAWFVFPPEHLFSGLFRGLYSRLAGVPWEATVYLGAVNLAVLCWIAMRSSVARSSLTFYAVFGMVIFAVLASGETLHIAGVNTMLPLPDAALANLPFFANVRTPSRAVVFVYLFLAVGIGFAVAYALDRRVLSKAGVGGLAALIVIDFYPANLAATPVKCPPGLAILKADTEHGFGVFDLPLGYADENSYMLEQVCHGRPIVVGMTSREMGPTLIYRLTLTDLKKQQTQLAQAHVKYVLLHKPRGALYRWQKELGPVARYRKRYPNVYDGADMTVLRVY